MSFSDLAPFIAVLEDEIPAEWKLPACKEMREASARRMGLPAEELLAKVEAPGRPLCQRCRAHRPGRRLRCDWCRRLVGRGCAPPEGPCWDAARGCCVDCAGVVPNPDDAQGILSGIPEVD